jgi:hypothetical protein
MPESRRKQIKSTSKAAHAKQPCSLWTFRHSSASDPIGEVRLVAAPPSVEPKAFSERVKAFGVEPDPDLLRRLC